jgi:hypothetical protein
VTIQAKTEFTIKPEPVVTKITAAETKKVPEIPKAMAAAKAATKPEDDYDDDFE